ncbi:MAG: hypothetical protein JXJ17_18840 [Anaerolineae bacterium]|nr:hypothetical protein [Anaerolineae bacterium]
MEIFGMPIANEWLGILGFIIAFTLGYFEVRRHTKRMRIKVKQSTKTLNSVKRIDNNGHQFIVSSHAPILEITVVYKGGQPIRIEDLRLRLNQFPLKRICISLTASYMSLPKTLDIDSQKLVFPLDTEKVKRRLKKTIYNNSRSARSRVLVIDAQGKKYTAKLPARFVSTLLNTPDKIVKEAIKRNDK